MNVALFEDRGYAQLLPLTWLRACCELRCGCDRLIDKVRTHLGSRIARLWVRPPLREVIADRIPLEPAQPGEDWVLLNARALVTEDIAGPRVGVAWQQNGVLVAAGVRADAADLPPNFFFDDAALSEWLAGFKIEAPPAVVRLVGYPWDLVLANGEEIRRQCRRGGEHLGQVYAGAHLVNPGEIHIAAGAKIKPGAVLDAEDGPIHVDHGAVVQPNAVIEGPCYVGPDAVVRPGAVIRGNTSIGPVCKVGGEIEGSIVHSHSNKQHDGFLGHSYVGQWVNLGADTVTSDLKNTYGTIRVAINGVGVETGQHFVGAIIGDHAKTGIGTILPTGCVIGTGSSIFTQSAVPRFVPSFAWLTEAGLTGYRIDKLIEIARIVMARRDVELSDAEERLVRRTADLARELEAAGWA